MLLFSIFLIVRKRILSMKSLSTFLVSTEHETKYNRALDHRGVFSEKPDIRLRFSALKLSSQFVATADRKIQLFPKFFPICFLSEIAFWNQVFLQSILEQAFLR